MNEGFESFASIAFILIENLKMEILDNFCNQILCVIITYCTYKNKIMITNFTFFLRSKLVILLACLLSTSAFAADIKDISFSLGSWTYTSGAKYNSTTKEVTITGNSATYEYARYTISLPGGTTNIYLSADIYLENIALGSLSYQAPKLKILQTSGAAIGVQNLNSPAQGSWYNTFLQTNTSGYSQVVLEFGFQNATGTFIIKNPKITNTQPVPTPYSFPYTYPSAPVCSLALMTKDTMRFNNDLLSTNSHFSWASKSWADKVVIDAINNNFPMSNYRFPGGTVGNFYDWTTDGYKNDPSTFDNTSRTNLYNSGFRFGYPGYKTQVKSSSGTATLMFNVLTDDITSSTNRLKSRLADGLKVKWVELGNENFFSAQSYGYVSGGKSQVSDVNEYIKFTKSLATALKAVSPSTKFTVCINHEDYTIGGWTDRLTAENYYDATTLHNYNNVGNEKLDFATGVVLLNSYRKTRKNIAEYKVHFGNTPTIFTEWGVLGSQSFLGVLSAADMFLAILEGNTSDGVVMQAGIHMLYHSDNNIPETLMLMDGAQMKYSPTGAFYAKLYKVFKDRKIYKALSNSDKVDNDLPSVVSRAVITGDSIQVFSVNKLPVASKLKISLDNTNLTGDYKIETYSMSPEVWPNAYAIPNDAWTTSKASGDINLPAYSISVVTISKNLVVTSLNEEDLHNTITIFPIPSTNKVYIDGIQTNAEYELFDTKGTLIKKGIYNSNGIEIEDLSSGVYYCKVNNQTLKVLKK
jgi:hypothetical protein